MTPIRRIAASLVLAVVFAASARGDSVWVSSGGGKPLEIGNVQVTNAAEGKLFFKTSSGRESARDFQQVVRLRLDDEPSLSAGEEALAAEKWDAASDAYQKTIKSTSKEWLKEWSARRLLIAAQKANRFDAAVEAYVTLVARDPAPAGSAAGNKPTLPAEGSTYLTTAAATVNAALANQKLSPGQRQALLGFLLDIQRARKDTKAAAEVMDQMLKAEGGGGSGGAGGASAETSAALARMKLESAAAAIEQKDFAKATAEINASRAAFRDPAEQAQALYLLAEAQSGQLAGASGSAGAGKDDASAWKDVALAYMRVVAHFRDAPGAPFVPQALLKTAAIEEKLKDVEAAQSLYQEIAAQFPDQPAAARAKEALARLKSRS